MENKTNSIVNGIDSLKKQMLENWTKRFSIIETIILHDQQNIAFKSLCDIGHTYHNNSAINNENV